MKRIAVVTRCGDAPGINAAVRAVVRTAIDKGWEAFGVRHGYAGLANDDFLPLGRRDVGGIIQRGGTMLGSKRYPEFKADDTQLKAIRFLRQREIDALVIIGGDGSQAGALALSQKGFPVVGVASTIDNDLCGAECIVLPETPTDPEAVARDLRAAYDRGKSHAIVVVAEGASYNAEALAHYFQEHRGRLGFELRIVKLGHVQRGGAPGVFDRLLATRLGAEATEC